MTRRQANLLLGFLVLITTDSASTFENVYKQITGKNGNAIITMLQKQGDEIK